MQVTLAGYNLDTEIINRVGKIIDGYPYGTGDLNYLSDLVTCLADETLTPETLSAAYARISRSNKSIGELRSNARASVNRARRTNRRIVFGLGHASIAEHAVVNLDISDISRLAVEELEAHRLASYTEASQRYIAMEGDFIIPREVSDTGLKDRFQADCDELFNGYRELISRLERLFSDAPEQERNTKAREDARYVLPLACRSQVGVTVNARIAERMINNFNRSPLNEVRELGRGMLASVKRIIPSLIRYTQPNRSLEASYHEIEHISRTTISSETDQDEPSVRLMEAPESGENSALAAILFSTGVGSYSACLEA
ncbi:MAG TPA: FAD-dependent thymidylate synthase, partial [Bacteroidetes bacterium]|nr:FAD-dependent thymidylate synthase [Bacteroidota bacterium]